MPNVLEMQSSGSGMMVFESGSSGAGSIVQRNVLLESSWIPCGDCSSNPCPGQPEMSVDSGARQTDLESNLAMLVLQPWARLPTFLCLLMCK